MALGQAPDAVYLERRQADYLHWAEATEGQLGNVTHDADVLALPYSPAHYEIRQLTPRSPRFIAFIDSEIARDSIATDLPRCWAIAATSSWIRACISWELAASPRKAF